MFKCLGYSVAMTALLTNVFAFGQEQPNSIPGKAKVVQPDKKRIVDQLQGKWVVVEVQIATKDSRDERFVDDKTDDSKTVFEFNGDEWSITQGDDEMDEPEEFSIDASKTPIWITTESTKGIFRIEGNTLIICHGENRPTRFDLVAGREAELYVLKRITDGGHGQNKAQLISRSKALEQLQGTWTYIGFMDGKTITEKDTGQALSLKINGDTATWRADGIRFETRVNVDDAKNPMQIEFSDSRPFYKPVNFAIEVPPIPMMGVFRVEGDTLKLRVAIGDKPPTEFDERAADVPRVAFVLKKKT